MYEIDLDRLELPDPAERLRYDAVVWRHRRAHWLKRRDWRESQKGNPWINAYGWNVVIFKRWWEWGDLRGFGYRVAELRRREREWEYWSIQDELEEAEPQAPPVTVVFGQRVYETADEAALAAFDWIRREARK